jgi:hypothetical protein
MPRDRLQPAIIKAAIAELDQTIVARPVMDIQVTLTHIEIQRGREQVFGLGLLLFEQFLVRLRLFGFGVGDGTFEEAGGRELLGIASDDDTPASGKYRQRLLQSAL